MSFLFRKKFITAVIILAVLGVGIFMFVNREKVLDQPLPEEDMGPKLSVIGTSVEGRRIEAHTFGDGETHLLFIGGVHGGYEWNSVILSYQLIDYLERNPAFIPENVSVTVIPSANPDGVYEVVGSEGRFSAQDITIDTSVGLGRFNSRDVDLNRNFDCKWKSESTWRGNVVSAGTKPFSEPEALAIRDFVLEHTPDVVIFWHSQGNAVYASECEDGILPETLSIMDAYSRASGYRAVESFDAYEITGDAEGWLASINIPALTVELSTHEAVEWEKNLAGIEALFEFYGPKAREGRL